MLFFFRLFSIGYKWHSGPYTRASLKDIYRHKDISQRHILPPEHHPMADGTTVGIEWLILTVLAILVILIFGGAIYAFFLAVWLFIFSWGDEAKIKQAWTSIRFMILGILMTLAFLFIFPLLFKSMKVPGYEVYTAQSIFKQATAVIKMVLNFGKDATFIYKSDSSSKWTTSEQPIQPLNEPQIEL